MTHRGITAEERRVSMAFNLKCVRKEISEGRRILRFRGVKCVAWPLKYDGNMSRVSGFCAVDASHRVDQ